MPGTYVLTCTALGYVPYVATGVEVTRRSHAAPPLLGQHTEAVLAWLDALEGEASR